MSGRIITLAMVLILLPGLALAANIEGTYDCNGSNPGGAGQYKGTVAIIKNGSNYNVTWNIGTQTYLGVGILSGNQFSVGYSDTKKSWFGVVVYKVDGKTLQGDWAMHGSGKNGTETLKKR